MEPSTMEHEEGSFSLKNQVILMAHTLYNKKAFNILVLDVQGISTLTDYFIIAEGNIDRHIKALADEVIDVFRRQGIAPLQIEGMHACDWIVIDYGYIVVHLFTPELRDRYRLEELWQKGSIVDIAYKGST